MGEIPFFTNVNWKINGDKRLSDAVTFKTNKNLSDHDDLDEVVSFESCLQLRSDSPIVDKCTLTVGANQTNVVLRQITIVSAAKKLEIYLTSGEYFTTVNCEYILKLDGFTVNKAVIKFPHFLQSCSVKFLSTPNPNEFWIYGIRITYQSIDLSNQASNLDMNRVMQRVQQSDQFISDKARGFANFLSDYQNKSRTGNCDMMNLIKSFTSCNKKWLGPNGDGDNTNSIEHSKNNNVVPENVLPTKKSMGIEPQDGATLKEISTHSRNVVVAEVSDVIRKEISEFEYRLWKQIDSRMSAIETRQKEIIEQLQRLTEFCLKLPNNFTCSPETPNSAHGN